MVDLIWSELDGREVILTEGLHVAGCGKIAGVFSCFEDAGAENADSLALATVAWESLTADQQAAAAANSAALSQAGQW